MTATVLSQVLGFVILPAVLLLSVLSDSLRCLLDRTAATRVAASVAKGIACLRDSADAAMAEDAVFDSQNLASGPWAPRYLQVLTPLLAKATCMTMFSERHTLGEGGEPDYISKATDALDRAYAAIMFSNPVNYAEAIGRLLILDARDYRARTPRDEHAPAPLLSDDPATVLAQVGALLQAAASALKESGLDAAKAVVQDELDHLISAVRDEQLAVPLLTVWWASWYLDTISSDPVAPNGLFWKPPHDAAAEQLRRVGSAALGGDTGCVAAVIAGSRDADRTPRFW